MDIIHAKQQGDMQCVSPFSKICVHCGKVFSCTTDYVYKRCIGVGGGSVILFYCSYGHLRAWDKMYDEYKDQKHQIGRKTRSLTAIKQKLKKSESREEMEILRGRKATLEMEIENLKKKTVITEKVIKNAVRTTKRHARERIGKEGTGENYFL